MSGMVVHWPLLSTYANCRHQLPKTIPPSINSADRHLRSAVLERNNSHNIGRFATYNHYQPSFAWEVKSLYAQKHPKSDLFAGLPADRFRLVVYMPRFLFIISAFPARNRSRSSRECSKISWKRGVSPAKWSGPRGAPKWPNKVNITLSPYPLYPFISSNEQSLSWPLPQKEPPKHPFPSSRSNIVKKTCKTGSSPIFGLLVQEIVSLHDSTLPASFSVLLREVLVQINLLQSFLQLHRQRTSNLAEILQLWLFGF